MRKRNVVFGMAVAVLAVSLCGTAGGAQGSAPAPETSALLSALEQEIGGALQRLDKALAAGAGTLAECGLKGPRAREVLLRLCGTGPGIVDCAAVTREGRMVSIEPKEYQKFEGADISKQAHFMKLKKTERPVMSEVFPTVEGFPAVDLEHPVFDRDGKLAGAASILFRPETFLAALIEPVVKGHQVEVWLMQKDGRILYDADKEEIGRMLFEDPMYQGYPESLARARKIAEDRSGKITYEFLGTGLKEPVIKKTRWVTIGLHGTKWRLVVIRPIPK